ncbi:MAG TPA: protein kinase, partial [Candidatus Polarisedimenticolaceae bacterium]|nr:protein kinase [Candidatus Polarisedimenticolaceae bacterium]
MIGRTLSHFEIIDKIGEGGMGVVYRAEDRDLGRQVALKVLHTEFVTDEERRKRFLREARTAASISHPNIATIHEVGESDGVIYIAMELVEGRTLKKVINEDHPAVDECLRLAIEICEGLGSAHQASIVHRDLKPDNVVIDGSGRVNILDFGLAKLYGAPGEDARDGSGLQTISTSVTRDGRILGTVQYMSPEQARGVELDARSDVFSLGIVLYELVTGQLPFHGETITDTLTSILRDEQPPIALFNPQVPVELERILRRCLEKDPSARYQDASQVLADLRKLKRMSDSQPVPLVSDTSLRRHRAARLPWRRGATLAAAAVLLVALGATAAAVLRGAGWLPGAAAGPRAMAVLPFANLQERDDPERLGQILQELIITDLSGFDTLKVLSSQRLFDVQKQLGRPTSTTIDRDVATRVAELAGADMMLTGSLSRLGSTWILTCQLIDLADGSVVQSDRIDGADLYAMVDDLTAAVRQNLDVDPAATDVAVTERTSSSLEAYQAYLTGVEALNELGFVQAIDRFEHAIEVDPSFGRAYYKLAIARWWKGSVENYRAEEHRGTPSDALEKLLGGNVKLSRKDRLLAEAFLELVESRPDRALPLFEKIVESFPDEKEGHYGLGEARFHSATRREERMAALEPFEAAIDLDPSFSLSFYHVVDLYAQAERYDEGIERVRGFIAQDPENHSWYQDLARLALAKDDQRMFDSVVDEALRRIDSRSEQREFLVGVQRMADDLDRRQALLDRALLIETDAMQQELLIAQGRVAAARDEDDRAEGLLRDALALDPRSMPALNALFEYFDGRLRFDDALSEAKRLSASDPDFPAYVGHWAAAAIKRGDAGEIDAAMRAVERLRERRAGEPSAMLPVGQL